MAETLKAVKRFIFDFRLETWKIADSCGIVKNPSSRPGPWVRSGPSAASPVEFRYKGVGVGLQLYFVALGHISSYDISKSRLNA